MPNSKLKDYTVFYRVTEGRCAIIRTTSPKQARLRAKLYLDNCCEVSASVHAGLQTIVTRVRDC